MSLTTILFILAFLMIGLPAVVLIFFAFRLKAMTDQEVERKAGNRDAPA